MTIRRLDFAGAVGRYRNLFEVELCIKNTRNDGRNRLYLIKKDPKFANMQPFGSLGIDEDSKRNIPSLKRLFSPAVLLFPAVSLP